MSVAIAVRSNDVTRRRVRKHLQLTFSGNYATGGDTLDFTAMTNPNKEPRPGFFRLPKVADFIIRQDIGGYGFQLIAGAGLNNWKMKIFTTANTELAAGAYPAGLTGAQPLDLEHVGPRY